jgi:hypothetical protein
MSNPLPKIECGLIIKENQASHKSIKALKESLAIIIQLGILLLPIMECSWTRWFTKMDKKVKFSFAVKTISILYACYVEASKNITFS